MKLSSRCLAVKAETTLVLKCFSWMLPLGSPKMKLLFVASDILLSFSVNLDISNVWVLIKQNGNLTAKSLFWTNYIYLTCSVVIIHLYHSVLHEELKKGIKLVLTGLYTWGCIQLTYWLRKNQKFERSKNPIHCHGEKWEIKIFSRFRKIILYLVINV